MTEQILTVTADHAAGSVTILTAVGEIDHDSRNVLDAAADAALQRGSTRLVIDLAGVTFCDSGGLSLFLQLHKETTGRGGSLHLAGARAPVLNVLTATNLDRLLTLHPTVADAVHASTAT
jgi:anti-sigma B factor antagonist